MRLAHWSDSTATGLYLKDGRTPPEIDTGEGCTLKLLCNAFRTSKKADSGEISPRSLRDCFTTCELLIGNLGKDRRVDDLRPKDFAGLRSKLDQESESHFS
jgi:hypothetical protein